MFSLIFAFCLFLLHMYIVVVVNTHFFNRTYIQIHKTTTFEKRICLCKKQILRQYILDIFSVWMALSFFILIHFTILLLMYALKTDLTLCVRVLVQHGMMFIIYVNLHWAWMVKKFVWPNKNNNKRKRRENIVWNWMAAGTQ